MKESEDQVRFHRKEALPMEELVARYIKQMKLAAGLNIQQVYAAWDECSGAGPYTIKKFFRSGKLYVTLSSSVYRNQLFFQKDTLIQKMNAFLEGDPLFTEDNHSTGYIKELILK